MAANEARRDLNEKLKLERRLMGVLSGLNSLIVKQTVKKYGNEGIIFDANEVAGGLEVILQNHYEDVAKVFSTQITDELPTDIAITEDEESLIAEALAIFFVARSAEQSALITKTNQKDIDKAIAFGNQTSQETEGGLSRQEQAMVAGATLSRRLRGRRQGIATTETQAAAETAKITEAQVLAFVSPSIVAPSPADSQIQKEWVTVADEKVRDAHVAADSQKIDMSKPFTVGGELLRYPGDTSLGASVGNVVNCRCSSVYDAKAVFAVRRKVSELPFVDTIPSEQLLESIG